MKDFNFEGPIGTYHIPYYILGVMEMGDDKEANILIETGNRKVDRLFSIFYQNLDDNRMKMERAYLRYLDGPHLTIFCGRRVEERVATLMMSDRQTIGQGLQLVMSPAGYYVGMMKEGKTHNEVCNTLLKYMEDNKYTLGTGPILDICAGETIYLPINEIPRRV